ncbi:MAG: hypothetical protein KAQ68_02250 [Clostridiales bacterium]|nr:hypothetical protein [Clostridiales bacterium]
MRLLEYLNKRKPENRTSDESSGTLGNIEITTEKAFYEETFIEEPYLVLKPKRKQFKGKIIYD